MKTQVKVFLKDYECFVVEQADRGKGTRYKAYGTFDDHFIEAQGQDINSALRRLKQKVEMALD